MTETDIPVRPARYNFEYTTTEVAALWRLAGLEGAAFDAEAKRVAIDLDRTVEGVTRKFYEAVYHHLPIIDLVPTPVLARIVAERLSR